MADQPTVHRFPTRHEGAFSNAYAVETESGIVAVDGLLTRSESSDNSESCTSSGQRVISSKRTIRPSAIPRSIGAGTRERGEGPSDTNSA